MLSRIAFQIRRWRHAEEEGAVTIYAGRWKSRLISRCAMIAIVAIFPPFRRYPWLLPIVIPALAAILVLALIGECRKAVIFTAGTIAYRPPFGAPRVIALQEILGLRRVATAGVTGRAVRGIALDLPNGHTEVWPLNFVEAQSEIVDRLSAATGKGVEGKWSWWYS
jgi:hypothetical protein